MVQFSVVLKHLRRHRPDWKIHVRCGRGKHTALIGLCHKVTHDQEPEPPGPYDSIVDLGWWENYCRYTDRPNSKVTNCLAEVFGLGWDADLARYKVQVSSPAKHRAANWLRSIGTREEDGRFNTVVIHYEGNTSPSKKNLQHWQAKTLVDLVLRSGRVPVVLDWDGRSPLPDGKTVFCPGIGDNDIWGGFGSGDAETIAAMISLSAAYIGIDSGPGKIASATDTPSLICWRGHHPIQFHDPAPNTVHLVPKDHRGLSPCGDDPRIADFFEKHYLYRTYSGEHGLASEACAWLEGVLSFKDAPKEQAVKFVTPNGIGDVCWALLKIKSIAAGRPIDVFLSGSDLRAAINKRAIPFVQRFSFVREVTATDLPVLHDHDNPANNRGRYNYVSDGLRDGYHYLVPNTALEAGRRIEDWLPDQKIDWDIFKEFSWEKTERGTALGKAMAPFVAFYLGPEGGHTDDGHNRGWLWEPKHWVELGKAMAERGLHVCVVGAPYDRSFWEKYVKKGVQEQGLSWIDLIGELEIGETFALLREAKCFISYQCGLGIVGHYLGVNVAMWWRPDLDSVHHEHYICFSEAMKDAWIRPGWENRYMGMLYRRETPEQIIAEIDKRGWLK